MEHNIIGSVDKKQHAVKLGGSSLDSLKSKFRHNWFFRKLLNEVLTQSVTACQLLAYFLRKM